MIFRFFGSLEYFLFFCLLSNFIFLLKKKRNHLTCMIFSGAFYFVHNFVLSSISSNLCCGKCFTTYTQSHKFYQKKRKKKNCYEKLPWWKFFYFVNFLNFLLFFYLLHNRLITSLLTYNLQLTSKEKIITATSFCQQRRIRLSENSHQQK